MIVQIMGKRWNLRFARMKDHGKCDAPTKRNKEILVRSNMSEKHELETVIHECLHAADWYKDEEWIDEASRDIARILYKLGWRKDATESH